MSTRGKKKDLQKGHGYLLNAWMPPVEAGEFAGCAATSFTFDPAFFVEECLSRCLGMTSDEKEDGIAYYIELEEKLNQTCCLALVDQAHACGTRTLRWDMLAARVPGAILHAKVSVLVWAAHVRIIVASANLTESGYRTNREVFGVLDYHTGSAAPLPVLREVLGFLRGIAERFVENCSARQRWMDLLRLAGQKAAAWGSGQPGMMRAVFTGLGQADALAQLKALWPMKRPPHFASVGSPFFDMNPGINRPAERLREMLSADAEVWWEVAGCVEPPAFHLKVPKTLQKAMPPPASQCFVLLHEKDDEGEVRDLHAKWLWLQNDSAVIYLIGSANFTSSGLGLSPRPNVEAGLAYVTRDATEIRELEAVSIAGQDVPEDAELRFAPAPNEDEDCEGHARLPMAFGSAVFEGAALRLSFHPEVEMPPDWEARMNTPDGRLIATEALWHAAGRTEVWSLPWDGTTPPSLLVISWPDVPGVCWWPVTLENAAALPPPEELRDLGLERLIEILGSSRPLKDVVKAQNRREKKGEKALEGALNPHDLVQVRHHLLPRARSVGRALAGLRRRLEQPATSLDALAWRLGHPVGAMALAEALQRESGSTEERVFLLTELILELGHVLLPKDSPPGCLSSRVIRAELVKTQHTLWQRIEQQIAEHELDTAMKDHALAAKEYLRL